MGILVDQYLSEGTYEAKVDDILHMLLPWIQKDPTAFCNAEEFETACETLKEFFSRRTQSVRKQLAGDLPVDSSKQERKDMVDASDISIQSMGALILGKMRE